MCPGKCNWVGFSWDLKATGYCSNCLAWQFRAIRALVPADTRNRARQGAKLQPNAESALLGQAPAGRCGCTAPGQQRPPEAGDQKLRGVKKHSFVFELAFPLRLSMGENLHWSCIPLVLGFSFTSRQLWGSKLSGEKKKKKNIGRPQLIRKAT